MNLCLKLTAAIVLLALAREADGQIYARPSPGPIQQPVPSGNLLQPAFVPPTNYSFYGPSTGTLGYTTTTTYYLQPGPCGDRLMPATVIVPFYGYTPGYYSGYYTPLFYRN